MSAAETCLNCGRGEAQIPVAVWRYQGRDLWICPDCSPVLIHQREKLVGKLEADGQRMGSG